MKETGYNKMNSVDKKGKINELNMLYWQSSCLA
jgi:hypothetical protein